MVWASSQLPESPGGGVFRLVPGAGPAAAALGLVPCSKGLMSVVVQGGAAGPVCPTHCMGHLPSTPHTHRGHCPFQTGPWNTFPVNLYLGNPEHRWRNCTCSQDKSNSHHDHRTEKLHRKSHPSQEALRCELSFAGKFGGENLKWSGASRENQGSP